jgi:hypothetical protein
MYERFGGLARATWYAAIGDIPDEIFNLANEYVAQRILKFAARQPRTEGKHPQPRLSKRAPAASQGAPMPEKHGVQHEDTEARKARRVAKALGKAAMAGYNRTWKWDELLTEAPTATLLPFVSVMLVLGSCRTAMF